MAGKITALKIQKRNKERVNIYLDDQYALAVPLMVAAGLKKGQYLSDAEIEHLKRQDEYSRAYQHAIRFLGFRARSRQEMEQYLSKKGYPAQVVGKTIERLLRENYLDDRAFAQTWRDERARFRPKSRQALRYELRQKGVAGETIEAVLEDLDEIELARTAIERKLSQWQSLGRDEFKKKLYGFLGRRGFDYEVCRTVFEQVWALRPPSE